MSTEKSQKIAAPSKARLEDKSLYLKVLQLYFAGYPSAVIAQQLEMQRPSVNRVLKRFRHDMPRQRKIIDYLWEEASKIGYRQFDLYLWFIENAAYMQRTQGDENALNLQTCMTKCPLTERPSNFIFDHVDVHYDAKVFPYPVDLTLKPDFSEPDFYEMMARKGRCRHCPFGAVPARNFAMAFAENISVYLDLNYYFSRYRVRKVSEFYFHYFAALIISVTRRIAMLRNEKALSRGVDGHSAVALTTRMQTRMVNRIYEMLLEPPPEAFDEFGCFIHKGEASGSSGDV